MGPAVLDASSWFLSQYSKVARQAGEMTFPVGGISGGCFGELLFWANQPVGQEDGEQIYDDLEIPGVEDVLEGEH